MDDFVLPVYGNDSAFTLKLQVSDRSAHVRQCEGPMPIPPPPSPPRVIEWRDAAVTDMALVYVSVHGQDLYDHGKCEVVVERMDQKVRTQTLCEGEVWMLRPPRPPSSL